MTAVTTEAAAATDRPTRAAWIVLWAMTGGLSMIMLDQTVVSVALATMSEVGTGGRSAVSAVSSPTVRAVRASSMRSSSSAEVGQPSPAEMRGTCTIRSRSACEARGLSPAEISSAVASLLVLLVGVAGLEG
jgi:hypothetical protein